jgi:hypothetical protein
LPLSNSAEITDWRADQKRNGTTDLFSFAGNDVTIKRCGYSESGRLSEPHLQTRNRARFWTEPSRLESHVRLWQFN